MAKVQPTHFAETVGQGILVGIAGGFAEIAWIAAYGAASGRDTTVVASAISTTLGSILLGGTSPRCPLLRDKRTRFAHSEDFRL